MLLGPSALGWLGHLRACVLSNIFCAQRPILKFLKSLLLCMPRVSLAAFLAPLTLCATRAAAFCAGH